MTTTSTGGWVETIAPGIRTKLAPLTMPHALVSNADGTFTYKKLPWDDRAAGDDITNPIPSFVGEQFNDVFFARNRLGFITNENAIMSRSGGSYYDFFRERATMVLDTDPIDIGSTDKDIALFHTALPFDEDVILWSRNAQQRITSGLEPLSPKTVEIKPASKYENYAGAPPVASEGVVYFAQDRGNATGISEYYVDQGGNGAAAELTEHVPRYVPANCTKLVACAPERMLFALSSDTPNYVLVYSQFRNGQERLQSAWSNWVWPTTDTILDIGVFASDMVLLIQRSDGLYLEVMSLSSGANDDNAETITYLDRRFPETGLTRAYDAVSGTTLVTVPYAVNDPGFEVWTRETYPSLVRSHRVHHSKITSTTLRLNGDQTTAKLFFGYDIPASYEFSEQFLRVEGEPRTDGRLQLKRFAVKYGRTSGFAAEVTDKVAEDAITTTTVNLQTLSDTAWAALQAADALAQTEAAITVTVPTYALSFVGNVTGTYTGITATSGYFWRLWTDGTATDSPVNGLGTISIPTATYGSMILQLIRTIDGVAVYTEPLCGGEEGEDLITGDGHSIEDLIGSYSLARSTTSIDTKAHALAVIAACCRGVQSEASLWAATLITAIDAAGRIPALLSRPGFPDPEDPPYLIDSEMWTATALAFFGRTFGADANAAEAKTVAAALADNLYARRNVAGLYEMEDGRDDPNLNILAYFMQKEVNLATGTAGYLTKATALAVVINASLWLPTSGRFENGTGTVDMVPLGPLFLTASGKTIQPPLARQWSAYFRTSQGGAWGYASRVDGLSEQGDFPATPDGIDGVNTALWALSENGSALRANARQVMADLNARIVVSTDIAEIAAAVIALDPSGLFGLAGTVLWTEGTISADRRTVFVYRFLGDTSMDEGRFSWPSPGGSDKLVIRLKPLGALPFHALSAEWSGFYAAKARKV